MQIPDTIQWGDMMISKELSPGTWEQYAARLRTGEKPPGGMPQPDRKDQKPASYPENWGAAPKIQTMDVVDLPLGGKGSSTMAKWQASKIQEFGKPTATTKSPPANTSTPGQTLGSSGGLFDSRPSTTPPNPSQSFLMAEQDKLTTQPAWPKPGFINTSGRGAAAQSAPSGIRQPAQAPMRQTTGPIVAGDGQWTPGAQEYHEYQRRANLGDPTAIRQLTQATPPDRDIYGNKIKTQSAQVQSPAAQSVSAKPQSPVAQSAPSGKESQPAPTPFTATFLGGKHQQRIDSLKEQTQKERDAASQTSLPQLKKSNSNSPNSPNTLVFNVRDAKTGKPVMSAAQREQSDRVRQTMNQQPQPASQNKIDTRNSAEGSRGPLNRQEMRDQEIGRQLNPSGKHTGAMTEGERAALGKRIAESGHIFSGALGNYNTLAQGSNAQAQSPDLRAQQQNRAASDDAILRAQQENARSEAARKGWGRPSPSPQPQTPQPAWNPAQPQMSAEKRAKLKRAQDALNQALNPSQPSGGSPSLAPFPSKPKSPMSPPAKDPKPPAAGATQKPPSGGGRPSGGGSRPSAAPKLTAKERNAAASAAASKQARREDSRGIADSAYRDANADSARWGESEAQREKRLTDKGMNPAYHDWKENDQSRGAVAKATQDQWTNFNNTQKGIAEQEKRKNAADAHKKAIKDGGFTDENGVWQASKNPDGTASDALKNNVQNQRPEGSGGTWRTIDGRKIQIG